MADQEKKPAPLAKPLFYVGQHINLHSVHFRVVKVTETRVVLAAPGDPTLKTWFEAGLREDRIKHLHKLIAQIREDSRRDESAQADFIMDITARDFGKGGSHHAAQTPDETAKQAEGMSEQEVKSWLREALCELLDEVTQ